MKLEHIAQTCHEVNRAYCAGLGDATQSPWSDAPEWQRRSAIKGVEFHLGRLNAGLPASPEASHESWLREKEAEGWTFGPVKDAEKKEHPCYVPYADLPAEQRAKDALFVGVVHGMAHLIETPDQTEASASKDAA